MYTPAKIPLAKHHCFIFDILELWTIRETSDLANRSCWQRQGLLVSNGFLDYVRAIESLRPLENELNNIIQVFDISLEHRDELWKDTKNMQLILDQVAPVINAPEIVSMLRRFIALISSMVTLICSN